MNAGIQDIVRGAYLVATKAMYKEGNCIWQQGELALVFFNGDRVNDAGHLEPMSDLLFESGRIVESINIKALAHHFILLYTDPDFVITGCSANDSWAKARACLEQDSES